jgi:glycosyltransferase involved in cell wall biosynthesis
VQYIEAGNLLTKQANHETRIQILKPVRAALRSMRVALQTPHFQIRARKPFNIHGRTAIAGVFQKRCGLQRAADLLYLDYQNRGYNVVRTNITAFTSHKIDLDRSDFGMPADLSKSPVDNIIIHAPPPLAAGLLRQLGHTFYQDTCIIGFWHWETARAPETWRPMARLMDEIWAPTPFVLSAIQAMEPSFADRLKLHPNPIHIDPFPATTPIARLSARKKLKISDSDFVASFSFAAGSGFSRKNPMAALDAFARAFAGQQAGVWFLMRCHDIKTYGPGYKALMDRARADRRIILDFDPDGLTIREFFAATDTLVSLHRAEGFGLIIAEAAQSGAKAIATGWGLAPELQAMPAVRVIDYSMTKIADPQRFFDPGDGDEWADPNTDQAASILYEDFLTSRQTT